MNKISKLLVWFFLSMYNAICTVTGNPSTKKMVLTGVINQGILGGFSGKVGPVVGGNWKGIDYMRGYVVPANPNTSGQQTQRTKFGAIVGYAQDLLPVLLNTYWDPFAVQMSGFNHFIQQNINLMESGNLLGSSNVMSIGTLEGTPIATATYDETNGETILTWDETVSGNGELTDSFGLVVATQNGSNFWTDYGNATRDDETRTITIGTGLDQAEVFVYGFFYRGTGAEFIVSDSRSRVTVSP